MSLCFLHQQYHYQNPFCNHQCHNYSDQSLDHQNNYDDHHKYDVIYVKIFGSNQFIAVNLWSLSVFGNHYVIIIVIS